MSTKPTRFVVYHLASTMEVTRYIRERDAKNLAAKRGPAYGVTDVRTYETKVVRMVERVNLVSGEKYSELSNTPGYLSPSRESYWSA